MYTFSELILNIRKVGKIDSRKMQGQSAFRGFVNLDFFFSNFQICKTIAQATSTTVNRVEMCGTSLLFQVSHWGPINVWDGRTGNSNGNVHQKFSRVKNLKKLEKTAIRKHLFHLWNDKMYKMLQKLILFFQDITFNIWLLLGFSTRVKVTTE